MSPAANATKKKQRKIVHTLVEKDTRIITRNKISDKIGRDEGILKRKYGYNVQTKTNPAFRQRCLKRASRVFGKDKVKAKLKGFISRAKNRTDHQMDDAIKRWEEDYNYVNNLVIEPRTNPTRII